MKLIVGLGNPGDEYDKTRHNTGFMCIDHYLKDVSWKSNQYGLFHKNKVQDEDVIFLKPTTFMNVSGNAVAYFVNYYKINVKNIIIVQDDLDLPLATIRIKNNSSAGGHNGIKSIIEYLKTQDFLRIKVGIARPNSKNIIDYVLHKYNKEEIEELNKSFEITDKIITDFISNSDPSKLMNKYN